jgi:hypothetical protein
MGEVSGDHNRLASLHIRLSRVAKALKSWSKSLASQRKVALAVCREVIEKLELAQEDRVLMDRERNLIKDLKIRILGLAVIEKTRAKQKSRRNWMRLGDANTKFFHLMTNIRKRRTLYTVFNLMKGLQLPIKISIKSFMSTTCFTPVLMFPGVVI